MVSIESEGTENSEVGGNSGNSNSNKEDSEIAEATEAGGSESASEIVSEDAQISDRHQIAESQLMVQPINVKAEDLDKEQFLSYELTVKVNQLEEDLSSLEDEQEGVNIALNATKDKKEKEILNAQLEQLDEDVVAKKKEQQELNLKLEVVMKVERGIFDNPEIAAEESNRVLAASEELEFEGIQLKEQAKQKRDSIDIVKKKQREEYREEADLLDVLADQKFEESAMQHALAQDIKTAEKQIGDLIAEQAEVLDLPEVTKELTEQDKQQIAASPEYKNYELVVQVARKKYKEADVLYVEADSLKMLSEEQVEQAIKLRDQAELATNESFKRDLLSQAVVLDSSSVINADVAQKRIAQAEVIYQEADERDQEAAQYLAQVDQDTYENIVAYEFSLDQDSARIAKELALAKVARDKEPNNVASSVEEETAQGNDVAGANMVESGPEVNNSEDIVIAPLNIEEAVVENITEITSAIDVVPDNLEKEIFVQEAQPTRSVYTSSKPIPKDTKLPNGVIYKVQVGAFRNAIPQDQFKGFAPIMGESTGSGLTRYTAGIFKNFSSATSARDQIRNISNDYGDAFVVAYFNGKRISIAEARRMGSQVATTNNDEMVTTTTQNTTIDNAVINSIESTTTVNSTSSEDNAPVVVNTPIRTNGGNNASGNAVATGVERIAGLFYTIQVGAYSKRVPASKLYNITPLNTDELANGTIRYSSGVYTDLVSAGAARDRIQEIGITDAFITAYYNGERISVADARQLVANNGSGIFADGSAASNSSSPAKINQVENDIILKVSLGTYGEGVPMGVAGAILKLSAQGVDKTENSDGTTTYTIGSFTDINSAEMMLEEVVDDGVSAATIIATNNGISIPLEEAKSILED